MLRRVEIVPHSPSWATTFLAEAERLRGALGEEVVAVHHVGSTAIPGISAKPIIDILLAVRLLAVREVERLDNLGLEMAGLGYEGRGEFGLPGRRYFVKSTGSRRTHHIHAYRPATPSWSGIWSSGTS